MGVSLRPTGAAEGRGSEGTPPEGSVGVPMGVRGAPGEGSDPRSSAGKAPRSGRAANGVWGVHPLPPPRYLIKANPSLPGRRGCGPGSGLPGRSGGSRRPRGPQERCCGRGNAPRPRRLLQLPVSSKSGGSCVDSEGKGGADRCSASRIRLFGWKKPDGKLRPRYLFALAASRGREPPQKEGEPTALRDWGLGLFP